MENDFTTPTLKSSQKEKQTIFLKHFQSPLFKIIRLAPFGLLGSTVSLAVLIFVLDVMDVVGFPMFAAFLLATVGGSGIITYYTYKQSEQLLTAPNALVFDKFFFILQIFYALIAALGVLVTLFGAGLGVFCITGFFAVGFTYKVALPAVALIAAAVISVLFICIPTIHMLKYISFLKAYYNGSSYGYQKPLVVRPIIAGLIGGLSAAAIWVLIFSTSANEFIALPILFAVLPTTLSLVALPIFFKKIDRDCTVETQNEEKKEP